MHEIRLFDRNLTPDVEGFLHRDNEVRDEDYLNCTLKEQDEGLREFYIIYHNTEIAGFCQYNRQPRYQPFRSLKMPEIQDLYIGRAYRQQGLATRLISHCEEKARREGHDPIGIGVSVSAEFGKAQRLYAGLGYQPDGAGVVYERRAVQPGRTYPVDGELCLMMVRNLSPESG